MNTVSEYAKTIPVGHVSANTGADYALSTWTALANANGVIAPVLGF